MRYPILTAVALAILLASPSHAEEDTVHRQCMGRAQFAETVFDVRARGMPLYEVLESAGGNALATLVARYVYTYPNYQSQELQARTRQKVADDIYRMCINNLED